MKHKIAPIRTPKAALPARLSRIRAREKTPANTRHTHVFHQQTRPPEKGGAWHNADIYTFYGDIAIPPAPPVQLQFSAKTSDMGQMMPITANIAVRNQVLGGHGLAVLSSTDTLQRDRNP